MQLRKAGPSCHIVCDTTLSKRTRMHRVALLSVTRFSDRNFVKSFSNTETQGVTTASDRVSIHHFALNVTSLGHDREVREPCFIQKSLRKTSKLDLSSFTLFLAMFESLFRGCDRLARFFPRIVSQHRRIHSRGARYGAIQELQR